MVEQKVDEVVCILEAIAGILCKEAYNKSGYHFGYFYYHCYYCLLRQL